MTSEQAVLLFKEKNPNLKFRKIGDYDDKHFVIEATKSFEDSMEVDPYYSVDKKTGEIAPFSPAEDLEKFISIMGYGEEE